MSNDRLRASAAVVALLLASGCGGGSGNGATTPPLVASPPGFDTSTLPSSVTNFAWGKELLKHAIVVGAVNESMSIGMSVMVTMKDPVGLVKYAQAVSDPRSGSYRHFLTPAQIADRFGASSQNYQAAATYFAQNGLHVDGWLQREGIYVNGPIAGFERAFGTKFGVWQAGAGRFVAPTSAPHTSVPVPIAQVLGMVHVPLQARQDIPNGQFRGYSPQQEQRAFDFAGPIGAGVNGGGVNVAIVGTGPIAPADATALSSLFNVTLAPIAQVNVTDSGVSAGLVLNSPSPLPSPVGYPFSSGFQTPPPVTAPCMGTLPTCNPEDIEAQLDTQTTSSMAPGASILFYLAYNPNDCFLPVGAPPQFNTPCPAGMGIPGEGIQLTDPETQQIIADDQADIVSMSFGFGEPLGVVGFAGTTFGNFTANGVGYQPVEMATMVAEGMALFASSGDDGAYECGTLGVQLIPGNPPCVLYPSGDPNVVSVGGVLAPLNADGSVRTQFTAWGFQNQGGGNGMYTNNIGSGGGVSTVFQAPPWQSALSSVMALGHGMRAQPDISMMGDPASGPTVVANAFAQKEVFAVGGTSLSAPQMAAMWALVLQACNNDTVCRSKGSGPRPFRLGNPAPLLYAIYANSTQYANTIFDVLYGSNPAFNPSGQLQPGAQAGPGYDLVTGIGVPLGGHLVNAVITNEGGTNPNLP